MSSPDQIILLLDVDAAADESGVLQRVPHERRHRHVLRLTDFGYERRPGVPRDRLDWDSLAAAILSLAERARTLLPTDGAPPQVYVGGFAPLSVFFAIGTYLDTRLMQVVSVQQRRNQPGTWDVLDLCATAGTATVLAAAGLNPGSPADGTGRVAVFLSTQVPEPPREAIRNVIQAHGDDLVGIARLTAASTTVDQSNIGGIVHDAARLFVDLVSTFPYRTGVTVFLAGPSSLALAAGLALNPNQYLADGRTIDLTEYVAGPYARVLSLPIVVVREVTPPDDPASQNRRAAAFEALRSGLEALQRDLQVDQVHVPRGLARDEEETRTLGAAVLERIRALKLPGAATDGAFDIDTLGNELRIGHGLLHPLAPLDSDALRRVGQLFTLHEVLHEDQGIGSHNYQGVGRTGVVLEEADFWADAFAIATAVLHESMVGSAGRGTKLGTALATFIDAHIEAMRAFDRMEQGSATLVVLPERRLRRYLIWHLQRARAAAVTTPAHVRSLFDARLFVELGPLRGHLDSRFDKLVDAATQDTTLAVGLHGRVARIPRLPQNFEPADFVEAVRRADDDTLRKLSTYVVNHAKDLLISWARP